MWRVGVHSSRAQLTALADSSLSCLSRWPHATRSLGMLLCPLSTTSRFNSTRGCEYLKLPKRNLDRPAFFNRCALHVCLV
eukprot:2770051-Amphidinium_carterae.1